MENYQLPEINDVIDFGSWKPDAKSERIYESMSCCPIQDSLPTKSYTRDEEEDFKSVIDGPTVIPGRYDAMDDRFESVMERVETVGFENFDSLVAAYYSKTFPESSPLYIEEWLSRNQRLPRVLSEIFGSSAQWTVRERQGFNEGITKISESILTAEGSTGHSAREGVCLVSLPMVESLRRPFTEPITDALVGNDGCYRGVSTTQAFAKSHDIRHNALLLECELGTCAACSAHDLVEDEENAVFVADGLNRNEVPGWSSDAATGCADDGLCDKSHHGVRAQSQEFVVELRGKASYEVCLPHRASSFGMHMPRSHG